MDPIVIAGIIIVIGIVTQKRTPAAEQPVGTQIIWPGVGEYWNTPTGTRITLGSLLPPRTASEPLMAPEQAYWPADRPYPSFAASGQVAGQGTWGDPTMIVLADCSQGPC